MTDHRENDETQDDDHRLGGAFDGLERDVTATVDVGAALAELHRSVEAGAPRNGGRRPAVLGVAAAVAVVLVAALVVLSNDLSTDVVTADVSGSAGATDGTSSHRTQAAPGDPEPAPTAASPADPCAQTSEARGSAVIYLRADAAEQDAARVALLAEQLDRVVTVDVVDPAATFEQFLALFSDQPELLASIDAGDLPTSIRVVLDRPWTAEDTSAVEHAAGAVLRVESSNEYTRTLDGGCTATGADGSDGAQRLTDPMPSPPATSVAGAPATTTDARTTNE